MKYDKCLEIHERRQVSSNNPPKFLKNIYLVTIELFKTVFNSLDDFKKILAIEQFSIISLKSDFLLIEIFCFSLEFIFPQGMFPTEKTEYFFGL